MTAHGFAQRVLCQRKEEAGKREINFPAKKLCLPFGTDMFQEKVSRRALTVLVLRLRLSHAERGELDSGGWCGVCGVRESFACVVRARKYEARDAKPRVFSNAFGGTFVGDGVGRLLIDDGSDDSLFTNLASAPLTG